MISSRAREKSTPNLRTAMIESETVKMTAPVNASQAVVRPSTRAAMRHSMVPMTVT